MNIDDFRGHVGANVIYRPPHVPRTSPGEVGVITSVGRHFVFVRYGREEHGIATPPECLELEHP